MSTTDQHPPPGTADQPRAHGDYSVARLGGGLVFTAGMTPRRGATMDGVGVVGADIDVDDAARLAAHAAHRAIGAARAVAQDAGLTVDQSVSLTVYVRAIPEFTSHSAVADGASAVLSQMLHSHVPARATVGVSSLPEGAPVEVTAVFTTAPATAALNGERGR
ncbi:RidA family protein [Pseudonocardia sp. C8]|uniref:RidA family protein n=1 Tax=Pseudonocardia sp. C8 TaxID=2762759 RepID=UPI0016425A62|nr:RidA family protein [Pseudonocardia sp. C8]MBC3191086.1 RidA family protein [Pseudonocardia sp. C8]